MSDIFKLILVSLLIGSGSITGFCSDRFVSKLIGIIICTIGTILAFIWGF